MPTEPTHQLGTSATSVDSIQAQFLLDHCHGLIGDQDYRGAAAPAQKAIDLVPNLPDPYVAMASMDCHEHPVQAYDEAYQRTQPDKRHEILTGRTCNKHCYGDYIGTIDDLTEMIALQPDNNPQCYTRRGITQARSATTKAPSTTSLDFARNLEKA